MFPVVRLRRNRRTSWLRELVAESTLRPEDLILPIFVTEGHNQKHEIKTMPGVYRLSIDEVILLAKKAEAQGIKAIALFPNIDPDLKREGADEAYSLDNLICRTVRALKNAGLRMGIICDVALDPYTTHGHDGIFAGEDVDNDLTIEALANQALVLAKAGVDIVAPSDMMDGRISAIREALDDAGFIHVNILAYSAKYNSGFYGPFRDAVGSNKENYLSKASYQMDMRNSKEAIREIELDVLEGADIVMVKPGMPYLDIVREASRSFNIPIFAFQVTGEYAMMKFAADAGALVWEKILIESLMAFKRAGSSAILTYAALEAAEILNKNKHR